METYDHVLSKRYNAASGFSNSNIGYQQQQQQRFSNSRPVTNTFTRASNVCLLLLLALSVFFNLYLLRQLVSTSWNTQETFKYMGEAGGWRDPEKYDPRIKGRITNLRTAIRELSSDLSTCSNNLQQVSLGRDRLLSSRVRSQLESKGRQQHQQHQHSAMQPPFPWTVERINAERRTQSEGDVDIGGNCVILDVDYDGVENCSMFDSVRSDPPPCYYCMPDLIILGAVKSGTTSLFRLLALHPQVESNSSMCY